MGGKDMQSPKSAAILRILTLTPNLPETFLSYCRNYQVRTRLRTCQLQQRMLHQLLQTNHKLHWEMFLQVRMPNKFRIYAYFQIILALAKLFCTGWHYFRLVQIILDRSKSVWTGIPGVSWCSFTQPLIHTNSISD